MYNHWQVLNCMVGLAALHGNMMLFQCLARVPRLPITRRTLVDFLSFLTGRVTPTYKRSIQDRMSPPWFAVFVCMLKMTKTASAVIVCCLLVPLCVLFCVGSIIYRTGSRSRRTRHNDRSGASRDAECGTCCGCRCE